MNVIEFTVNGSTVIAKRIFNAPVVLVWRTWTEAGLLDRWWAPKPWKTETKTMAFKAGGYRLYAMVSPEGEKHWGLARYETIINLKEFSGKDAFCDDEGHINTALPVASFLNRFNEKNGRTEVIVTTTYPNEDDLQKIIAMGIKEGLAMAFENLDRVLKGLTG